MASTIVHVNWKSLGLSLIGLLLRTHLLGSTSASADPLGKVLADWEHRRQRLPCLEWRLTGETVWTKGSRNNSDGSAATPSAFVEGKMDIVARFNFLENRFRSRADVDSYFGRGNSVTHNNLIRVGNAGRILTQLLPGSDDSQTFGVDFVIQKGEPQEMPTGDVDLLYWRPIFWASGIVITKSQLLNATLFPRSNITSAFAFKGFDTVNGKSLAMLSVDLFTMPSSLTNATNYVRYWVDLERDSAIVRAVAESGVPGVQMAGHEITVEYAQHTQTWLPIRWVVKETRNSKTTSTESIQVSSTGLIADDDPALYSLEPAPNTRVYETDASRDPKTQEIIVSRRHYVAQTSGQSNLLKASLDRYDTRPPGQVNESPRPSGIAILALVAVTGCFAFFILRGFRQAR
jgi:hypothetical protein